jgi:hypothetical protein
MSLRKTFFVFCQVLSILCLVIGYGIVGHWVGAVIALLTSFAWLLARIYPASGLSLICLLASVSLAVAGVLTGSPPLLMISGSGFTLATWDLLLLDTALRSNVFGEQTKRDESKHLQSLALAMGSGLFMGFLGRYLNLQIPFIVLVLFVSLVIFGLDRIWGYIKKTV